MASIRWKVLRSGIDYGSYKPDGALVDVEAWGPDIEDLVNQSKAKQLHGKGRDEKSAIYLGFFDEQQRFNEEWFELNLDPEWIWNTMPESVKQDAWGSKRVHDPAWSKVFG